MPSLRALLLGLVLIGAAGLTVELALLEHYASVWQTVPLVVLVLGLAAALAVARRPVRGSIRFFRVVMVALVITGAIGVFLHYDENVTFERELSPDARGLDLVWLALRGATPILAPGAFVQLGLLGLILVYDHPALRGAATEERKR
jgi:hypothetical protein